jgi:inhibitor of KinA sporulation pathway (predicted exonuclease)
MDAQLHAQLDEVIEALRDELHQQTECWSIIRTPSELFNFEQGLQAVLNSLQAGIVGAVLEAIHRDRDFVTDCRHQARQQRGVQSLGWHTAWVRTLGGKRVQLKTLYARVPTHGNQEGRSEKRFQHGTGLYPVLRRLGIVREATPRLLAEVNSQSADGPSGAEAVERFASREIRLTQQPMWGLVRDFASIALWQRQVEADYLDHVTVHEPAPLAGKRVVVGLDGGRLRLRINKIGSEQTPTRKYSPDQCEPKLCAIYTVDDQGKKERKGGVFYDDTLQSADALFTLLKLRLTQLGIQHARLLVIIGDGASWIWNGIPALWSDLALTHLPVVEIVDWGHAAGKLMPPATVGLPEPKQQQQWFKRMRTLLKQGKVNAILDALQALDQRHDTDEVIRTAIHYFQTHAARMQYETFRAAGLPIGSGVIESGVRRIINLRLKGVSIFWSPENAEGLLYLRCQSKSGRWVQFVKSVLTHWASDMSISLTQAYQVRDAIATAVLASHPPVCVSEARQEVIRWARQMVTESETLLLDTETTGLDDHDEVIQLAIIDMHDNVLLDTLVRPTVPVGTEARAIHGITDEVLAQAPSFSTLYETIAVLIGNRSVLAYNADFDRRILAQTCAKYGLPPFEAAAWDCVMERYASFWGARSQAGHDKPQSLSTACMQQGIDVQGHHDAVKDCLLTLALIKAVAVAEDE